MKGTRALITYAAIGALVGFALGVAAVAAQNYATLGLWRNAALLVAGKVNGAALVGLVLGAIALLVGRVLAMPRHRPAHPFAFGLCLVAAAAVAARIGWSWNRYRFVTLWKDKTEIAGVHLPRALTDGRAIAVNAAIVAGAALAMIILYLVARALLAGPWSRGRVARGALATVGVAGVFVFASSNVAAPVLFRDRAPAGPNVLILSLDNLRADGLGCYGVSWTTSPAIDAFSAECVLFENAQSQSPHTLPSHASFLTSRYPSVNRASTGGKRLPAPRVLAPEIFREAGYRTEGIVDTPFLTGLYGLDQGYDRLDPWGRHARRIVPETIGRLEKIAGRPFYFFAHVYDIHAPYAKEDPYRRMFLDFDYKGNVSSEGWALSRYQRMKRMGEDPGYVIGEQDARYLKALYGGGIRSTDDRLGELLRLFSDGPLGENTIVVITADHGEEFLEHDAVLHDDLYRTVTHVPLLIRLPGAAHAGLRVARPVGLIDLLPTLLDLTGVTTPAPLDGASLVPLLEGSDRADRPVFAEMPDGEGEVSVVSGEWHLVGRPEENRWELFRYGGDPLEQIDQASSRPELVDSLRAVIRRWRAGLDEQRRAEPSVGPEEANVDEATRDQLRSLGYIE